MKRIFERVRWMALGLAAAAGVTGCGHKPAQTGEGTDLYALQIVDTAMGTIFTGTIDFGEQSGELGREILQKTDALEKDLLSWRVEGSEVYRINAWTQTSADGSAIELSDEMREILTTCIQLSEDSEGAFDITLGTLTGLWDIDSWAAGAYENADYELPAPEQIARARAYTGYEQLSLEESGLVLPEGMRLDLGAVGKGLALDEIRALLEERLRQEGATDGNGAKHNAVISMGGSVLTYGEKPDGSPWRVAVLDPFDTSGFIGYLSLEGTWCVSTSGDYERYVEVDGRRYCHILDPKTGYPAAGELSSVTVLAGSGLLSDGLSTACFLLGTEEGMKLAGEYGAEALFVDRDGHMTMTDGMRAYFQARRQEE